MNGKLVIAIVSGALVMIGGCNREEPAAVTPASPASPAASDPGPVTAQRWVDDFEIGTQLGANDDISTQDNEIRPGETIYVAMDVTDAPADTSVTVQWYGPMGDQLAYEVKKVPAGEDRISFMQESTADWQQGNYKAEVWVGDEKVNEQNFQVTAG